MMKGEKKLTTNFQKKRKGVIGVMASMPNNLEKEEEQFFKSEFKYEP
jgi:hypothetical protein